MVSFAKSPKRNIQILLYSIDMMQSFINRERQTTNIIQQLLDMERRRTIAEERRVIRVERDRKKRAVSIFTSKDWAHAQGPTAIRYCLVCEGALALLQRPKSPLGLGYPGFLVLQSLRAATITRSKVHTRTHSHRARVMIMNFQLLLFSTLLLHRTWRGT